MSAAVALAGRWRCPVCDGTRSVGRFRVRAVGSEAGVDAAAFRPSSEDFGRTAGSLVRCTTCGHGSLAVAPPPEIIQHAYAMAADPVSLREEAGQVETARRALALIERVVSPARLADLGCWTGSFLVAASARGWDATGVEPSEWAVAAARKRGVDARAGTIDEHGLDRGVFRLVTFCDVLEHLPRPGAALDLAHDLLETRGALYVTVPDAGSPLARLMGRRWWSVLPMHLQYFTRTTMRRLLEDHGFRVVMVRTHAKAFSARYYAERLAGYAPRLSRTVITGLERLRLAERMMAPDFRDRMAVIAVRD